MDLIDLAEAVVFAQETGATVTAWEFEFIQTLAERLVNHMEGEEFWLSPGQRRSLHRLAENFNIN